MDLIDELLEDARTRRQWEEEYLDLEAKLRNMMYLNNCGVITLQEYLEQTTKLKKDFACRWPQFLI